MTTRVRKTLEVLALLAVIGSRIWIGTPSAAASTTFRSPRDYVALAATPTPPGSARHLTSMKHAQRSSRSYPPLWAVERHPASFWIRSMLRSTDHRRTRQPIPAVQPGTDLVTITIGGNDAALLPCRRPHIRGERSNLRYSGERCGDLRAIRLTRRSGRTPTVGPYHPTATGYRDGYLPALDTAATVTT
jgi:hypothetical protein